MPHYLRYSQPWQPIEITARTIQGRYLLQPSKQLNELIVGIVARAKRRYEVEVYGIVVLSNHLHMLVAGRCSNVVSRFQNYVLGNIAREANALHGWSGRFWHRRGMAIPIVDEDAQVDRLRYLLSNSVKEGLVGHPFDWPGLHCAEALVTGESLRGRWVDRTAHFRCKRKDKTLEEFTSEELLHFDPLPAWSETTERTRRARLSRLVDEIVAEHGGHRRARLRRLKREHEKRSPLYRPRRLARSPAPLCHASTPQLWAAFKAKYWRFVNKLREATSNLCQPLLRAGLPRHGQLGAIAAGCRA